MADIPFIKYHGAGNDFILIDDRDGAWGHRMNEGWIAHVCHRRFGIGADGLILLQKGTDGADFFMKYYNSDGKTSTFCGNGGRCIVSFAAHLGIHSGTCRFLGTDGWHSGVISNDGLIYLTMADVKEITRIGDHTYVLNTGSPHYVTFGNNVELVDVPQEGRSIRNSPAFEQEGINVNFVEQLGPFEIGIRTYERGVEDETMACGTGIVAASIAHAFDTNSSSGKVNVHAVGGNLAVEFVREGPMSFSNVRLIGPAVEVFRGEIKI